MGIVISRSSSFDRIKPPKRGSLSTGAKGHIPDTVLLLAIVVPPSATQRNRQPILEVLLRILPPTGEVLEIASGTGEHAIFFAPALSPRLWIPSDPNPIALKSIESWQSYHPSENLYFPQQIDVLIPQWWQKIEPVNLTAIVNINMIHISSWLACLGLMEGAKNLLPSGGILYLYGPYKEGGKHTAPSNESFDQSLRLQNAEWGVRNLEDIIEVAENQGFVFKEKVTMPANNLSVIFKKE